MGKINNNGRKVQVGGGALDTAGGWARSFGKTVGTPIKGAANLGAQGSLSKIARVVSKPDTIGDLGEIVKHKDLIETVNTWTPVTSGFAEEELWEALWNEPCYMHPETKTFSFSKLGDLWCTWTNENNSLLKAAKAVTGPRNYLVNQNELMKFFTPLKKDNDGNHVPVMSKEERDDIEAKVKAFAEGVGKYAPDSEKGGMTIEQMENSLGNISELKKLHASVASLYPDHFKNGEEVTKFIKKPGAEEGGGPVPEGCDMSKFFFCLFAKFLLGPAGYLVLKMAPHFVKFWYATTITLQKIFYSLSNTIMPNDQGIEIPYTNNKGKLKFYKPNLGTLILTYLGTVIPFHIFKFSWGAKYGRGEFGKIIVGLVMVSIALITIGGIGITMLILTFSFYCIKVMGMFSDNIQEKKKK